MTKLIEIVRALGVKGARCDDEHSLAIDAIVWPEVAKDIVAARKLRKLQLFKALRPDLAPALATPELRGIEELSLFRNPLDDRDVATLVASDHLTTITTLDLKWCAFTGRKAAMFASADPRRFPALRRLSLSGNRICAIGIRALATSRLVEQLTDLDLYANHAGDEACAEFFASPAIRNLERLVISGNEAKATARKALVTSSFALRLTEIDDLRQADVRKLLAANAQADRPWVKPEVPTSPLARVHIEPARAADERGAILVAKLAENPDDAETRSVYADWLLEHGDVRGELMTLAQDSDEAARVRVKVEKGFHHRFKNKHVVLEFQHGMIVGVRGSQNWFIQHGKAMLANDPIRSVMLDPASAKSMKELVKLPGVARLAWLSINHATPGLLDPIPFSALPHTAIELAGLGGPRNKGLSPFLDMPQLRHVRSLKFWTMPWIDDWSSYVNDPRLAHITHLEVTYSDEDANRAAEVLLESSWQLERLTVINVSPGLVKTLRKRFPTVIDRDEDA